MVASPQICNQATLGGNVSQDTLLVLPQWLVVLPRGRQHLLRGYADGDQQEHATAGDRCVAVSPAGHGTGAGALDTELDQERAVSASKAEDSLGPQIDITRMTVLQPGELLTTIRIRRRGRTRRSTGRRSDRNVWDFPLVNVASALKLSGTTISDVRVAVGAVAARPLRLTAVWKPAASRGSRGRKRRRRRPAKRPSKGPWRCATTPTRFR